MAEPGPASGGIETVTVAAGIVGFTWIGFDEEVSIDNMIVLHFHVEGEVYVRWAKEEFVDPAGFVID